MIVAESRRGRRIVGRLDRGAPLFEALLQICRERHVRAGELRALGSLETAEVAEFDQAARTWKPGRKFAGGGFEVLSLTGNVSEKDGALALHAHVTLMRDRDNGVELVGGHLVAARVFALEFVIEAWDDVVLRRAADPATGLALWSEAIEAPVPAPAPLAAAAAPAPPRAPEPAPVPEPRPTPSPARPLEAAPLLATPPPAPRAATPAATRAAWAQVAAVSTARPVPAAEPDDLLDDMLEPGDIVIHPTFGRCEVQRLEGSYEFAHVLLKSGRLVRLSLDVLKVRLSGREGSRRVFQSRVDG